ncbi:MAG: hypothetical protein ACRCWQ_02165 [Bacilli bacterium]
MKTRNGFVSNSSSSSFIICGLNLCREDIIKAYDIAGAELTEEDKTTILEESVWEWPDFPGPIEAAEYEYTGTWLGVAVDPTCLSVNSCLSGFVGEGAHALMQKIGEELGEKIKTYGDTEYC